MGDPPKGEARPPANALLLHELPTRYAELIIEVRNQAYGDVTIGPDNRVNDLAKETKKKVWRTAQECKAIVTEYPV